MTYQQNEESTAQRLEYLVEKLRNQLTTAHIELAQRDDRIADLERQMVSAGEFHLQSVDQATDYLTQERDGLQSECNRLVAMIADLVKKYDPARVYGPNVITALPEAIEQLQIDAEVAREEFHRMKAERDQARAEIAQHKQWLSALEKQLEDNAAIGAQAVHGLSALGSWLSYLADRQRAQDTPPAADAPGFSAAHNPDV